MNGPINPLGTTLPDGRWWPAIGGEAMCDGDRVRVRDVREPLSGDVYRREAVISWPLGMDDIVDVNALSPVPEYFAS